MVVDLSASYLFRNFNALPGLVDAARQMEGGALELVILAWSGCIPKTGIPMSFHPPPRS